MYYLQIVNLGRRPIGLGLVQLAAGVAYVLFILTAQIEDLSGTTPSFVYWLSIPLLASSGIQLALGYQMKSANYRTDRRDGLKNYLGYMALWFVLPVLIIAIFLFISGGFIAPASVYAKGACPSSGVDTPNAQDCVEFATEIRGMNFNFGMLIFLCAAGIASTFIFLKNFDIVLYRRNRIS